MGWYGMVWDGMGWYEMGWNGKDGVEWDGMWICTVVPPGLCLTRGYGDVISKVVLYIYVPPPPPLLTVSSPSLLVLAIPLKFHRLG